MCFLNRSVDVLFDFKLWGKVEIIGSKMEPDFSVLWIRRKSNDNVSTLHSAVDCVVTIVKH